MKHSINALNILFMFFFSVQLYSQTYFNVLYTNSSKKTIDISELIKITFNGADIIFQLASSDVTTDGMSTISNVTFGASNGGSLLPVELVSFIATVDQKTITLSWYTATEVNNYGFEIERSTPLNPLSRGEAEGRGVWEKIGFVQGHGNSNSPKTYSFKDTPQEGIKFQYRLKQIDSDGKFEYSDVVEVTIEAPANFVLKHNFPNPFNPQTKIVYNLPIDGFVTLKVFDVLGREVASLVNENKKAGSYEATLDGSRLASGVYICKMSSANYSSAMKMLIMK